MRRRNGEKRSKLSNTQRILVRKKIFPEQKKIVNILVIHCSVLNYLKPNWSNNDQLLYLRFPWARNSGSTQLGDSSASRGFNWGQQVVFS